MSCEVIHRVVLLFLVLLLEGGYALAWIESHSQYEYLQNYYAPITLPKAGFTNQLATTWRLVVC